MKPKQSGARPIRLTSVLPPSCEEFSKLGPLHNWYRWLWYYAPKIDPDGEFDLLRAYASMLIDTGLPHPAAIDCLMVISRSNCRQTGSIRIPAQRHNYGARETELSFSKKTSLAIHCYLGKHVRDEAYRNTRQNRLIRRIERNVKKSFALSVADFDIASSLKFQDLKKLGCMLALHFGSEPFLISALSSTIRPVSQSVDDPYQLTGISQESLGHMLMQHDGITLRQKNVGTVDDPSNDEQHEIPSDWIAKSKNLLRDLCKDLGSSVIGRADSPKKRRNANEVFDIYELRAAQHGPNDSAVVLAVKYARQYFIDKASITAGTLRDYLDRSVINGLLDNENSYSLGDWDPDDFIENLEDRISSTRLHGRSRQIILSAYRPFLDFLSAELKIPGIDFKGFAKEYVGGAGQWRLIGPHAIDKLISELAKSKNRDYRQCTLVTAIAYYCGLRASEIRRLTLSDIVFDNVLSITDLECLRGKTPNARRRIPYDKMAPTYIVDLVRKAWHDRRAEFSSANQLSKIRFLGPPASTGGYRYDSLVRLTRQLLKSAFGESVNVHLLRHCYCSNLFVRWYALRYPDVLDRLRDRSHPLFQPTLQSRLQMYFDCMPFEDGDIRPYDLISMIKLTGHASPETLFQYYIHSFSVVQRYAVSRMETLGFDAPLSDVTIARLMPRMKSSASRAKLQSRTIDGISTAVCTRPSSTAVSY